MAKREIEIPPFLHELQGENTSLPALIIVYLTGLIVSITVFISLSGTDLALWKRLLAAILFLDIGSGTVANLTSSVNQYYQNRSSLKPWFLLLHILHPAVLIFIFPGIYLYFICIGLFTVTSALMLGLLKDCELQQAVAALLLAAGITFSFFFNIEIRILYIFGPLFIIKLVLGFAVRRPDFRIS